MTWSPPPRPEWVAAVNRGDVVPMTEEAGGPFVRDELLAEARARMGLADGGLGDFGDPGFAEPLDRFIEAVEGDAALHVMGRWMTRRFLVRLLCGRLQLLRYPATDPGVLGEQIVEPLVVTGAPRTGTTILHALLAQDPLHRAPLGWELLYPVPPPDPAAADDDARIALADRELRLLALVSADLDSIHEYSGRMTKECLSAMSFTFRTEELTSRYHVPAFAGWLAACDMRPAYESHRRVLQILQRRWEPRRWTLKSPVHLHSLPTLLDVYPDARIVVTHRDPLTVLSSVTSLIATLRWAHSDRVDYHEIAAAHARMYHADLDGLVTACQDGTLDPARVHHVRYDEFMASPLDTVRGIYDEVRLAHERRRRGADDRLPLASAPGTARPARVRVRGPGPRSRRAAGHVRPYQDAFGVPSET